MITKIHFKLLLIIFLISCFPVLGQDIKKDLEEMGIYYKETESFKSVIEVKIYSDQNSPLIQTAKILKKGRDFYYELGDTKMLVFPTSILMIYENQKNLLYKTINEKEYEACLKRFTMSNLDSIISYYDSVRYVGISNNEKHYIVYMSKGQISKTDFYINTTTKAISKLIYYYNKNLIPDYSKVQIFFNNGSILSVSENTLLNEKRYIIREGKNIKPSERYNQYHLINTNYED